jgi:sigma-B regulation protein RsbU (phosphoserine phosphatase)
VHTIEDNASAEPERDGERRGAHPTGAEAEAVPEPAQRPMPEPVHRPAPGDPLLQSQQTPLATAFLIRLAETLSTTLDLRTLLKQTAELVRAVLDFRIFAIFLINDRTGDLRMRFQIGHEVETERIRMRIGQGIVGTVAETRQAMLVNDVSRSSAYIEVNPRVCSELAVPLIVKGRLIGVIDIESEQLNYFRPEHLHLLTLTASRISQAIENARLYSRVARQAHTLTVLNDIAREFTAILDLAVLFARIGELLRRLLDFQFFTIWIINESDGVLESRFATRFGEAVEGGERLPVNHGLVGTAIAEGKLVHSPDVRKDVRYHLKNKETRSELVVPLIYKNKVIGVLELEHTRSNYFTEDHERTLTTLASQIAISIENARLYQRLAQQEQRLEHDLDMAREVQLRLLPHSTPQHLHAEFAARFLPARAIGGDMYDFLRYDSNRSAIALGDVSGKAAPAALYAALVSGIMRSAGSSHPSPSEMLALLNDSLQERHVSAQYVAMVYAVWNDENMTLQIANAGATQPIFYRARPDGGTVDIVRAEGFPLGLFPEVSYEEISLATRPGDALVFLSDGITDAQNASGEMFGMERVAELMRSHSHASAADLALAIAAEVTEFEGDTERFDDETVLVLRVR